MANKKINELSVRTPSLSDLMLVGDPSTGYSYKATISSLSTLLEANIALNDLSDVVITSVANGNLLAYNGTNWVNRTLGAYLGGTITQYVRGDGSLGDFSGGGGGGGSSVSYYLNGSVNQGTFVGTTYYEMNKTAIIGAGTDFTINANGYIASFITDAGDPALLNIPGGNWNLELYFSASSAGGTPSFYVELYKYDGTTFTLIASNSGTPEGITNGTAIDAYFTSISVPETVLTLTDRLAIRVYVTHSGRTITLHTENSHLCQIITTFTTGLTALNNLTAQVQYLVTGTSGTDFAISSTTATHTFNLPTASGTNRGALSSADWTTFNGKVGGSGTTNYVSKFTASGTIGNSQIFDDGTNIGVNSTTPYSVTNYKSVTVNGTNGGIFATQVNGTNAFNISTSSASTYIVETRALPIQIGTNNTEKVRILSNGNVGIGTITPVSLLELNGTNIALTLNNAVASTTNLGIASSNGSYSTDANTGDFIIRANSKRILLNTDGTSAALIMHTSKNITIGTNTDGGYKLDVNGTARVQNDLTLKNGYVLGTSFTNQRLGLVSGSAINSFFDLYPQSATGGIDVGFTVWSKGSPSSITNYELLEFRYDNTNRKYALNSSSGGTGSILPIDIYTGANTSQFRLATSGNVLVGTTTDGGYRLDVLGTTRISGTELRLDNGTTGTLNIYSNTPSIQFFSADPTGYRFYRSGTGMFWNSAGSITTQISGNDAYTLNASSGHIWRTALSGGAATARLTTGGNLIVGGTTDAGYRADIQGTFRSNHNGYGIVLTSTTGNRLQWIDNGTFRWAIGSQAIQGGELANSFNFYSATNSATQFSIASDGAVMIGVPYPISSNYAPSAQLQVASTTKGFLPPRMTGAQAEAITGPAAGLMVYSTDGSGATITSLGWWGFNGTTWVKLN